jgi:hypothetical protein
MDRYALRCVALHCHRLQTDRHSVRYRRRTACFMSAAIVRRTANILVHCSLSLGALHCSSRRIRTTRRSSGCVSSHAASSTATSGPLAYRDSRPCLGSAFLGTHHRGMPCHAMPYQAGLCQSNPMRRDATRCDAMRCRLIQDEGMWVAQLHKDRDLIAQFDAVQVAPFGLLGRLASVLCVLCRSCVATT